MQALFPILLLSLACLGTPTAPPAAEKTASQAAQKTVAGVDSIEQISVQRLHELMEAGPLLLVDVRTPGEYSSGHVPKARSIPLSELPERIVELESHRGEPVYLICAVGGRSMQAAELLSAAGFKKPINISGGTRGWKEKSLPLE